jgi:hypothetical protein
MGNQLLDIKQAILAAALCAGQAAAGFSFASADGRNSMDVGGYLAGYGAYGHGWEDEAEPSWHGKLDISAGRDFGGGLRLGAVSQLSAHPGGDKNKPLGELYAFSEGSYGRIEIGRAKNIARKMHISAPDVGPLFVTDSYYFARGALPRGISFLNSTAIRTDRYSGKINAVSAPIAGFQVAGSYIPGADELRGGSPDGKAFKHAWTGNVKYSAGDAFAITAGGARFLDIDDPGYARADVREEYSAGMKFYLHGWQLSASGRRVVEKGESGPRSDEGYSLDYGIAYEMGPLKLSLSDFYSSAEGDRAVHGRDEVRLSLLSWRWSLADGVDALGSAGRMACRNDGGTVSVGGIAAAGIEIYF